jgi:hypothetical protein
VGERDVDVLGRGSSSSEWKDGSAADSFDVEVADGASFEWRHQVLGDAERFRDDLQKRDRQWGSVVEECSYVTYVLRDCERRGNQLVLVRKRVLGKVEASDAGAAASEFGMHGDAKVPGLRPGVEGRAR